jgi:hypothetical protein
MEGCCYLLPLMEAPAGGAFQQTTIFLGVGGGTEVRQLLAMWIIIAFSSI